MTAQHHTMQRRMVDAIDQQLADRDGSWILRMKPEKLELVRRFVLSFIVEPGDHLVPFATPDELVGSYLPEPVKSTYKVDYEKTLADMRADRVKLQGEIERLTVELGHAHATRPLPPSPRYGTDPDKLVDIVGEQHGRVTADIEALAQRLAKVEDILTAHKDILRQRREQIDVLHTRIDKAAEIIGGRIGGLEERLEERLTELRYMFDQVETRTVSLLDAHSTDIAALKFPVASFGQHITSPTSATVGAALAQVEEPDAASEPLKPQRGDRVRLEGARSITGRRVSDGWYDVIGHNETVFQIATRESTERDDMAAWLPWLGFTPAVQEVRRGAANLPE